MPICYVLLGAVRRVLYHADSRSGDLYNSHKRDFNEFALEFALDPIVK